MYQMSIPTLLIRDLDLLKQVCVKDFDQFVDHRSFVPDDCDPLWSKNLFALKGQRWKEMRPILSPSFTSSKMRAMFLLMSDCAKRFVKFFDAKSEEIIELEMKDCFTRYCNDVIATCAFGVECDSLNQPNNTFYTMGKRTTDLSSLLIMLKFIGYSFVPWLFQLLKIPLFDKEVKDFFYHLVDETIKAREEKGIVRPDMIHLLLEARKGKIKPEDETTIDAGFSTVQESTDIKEISNQDIASQAMVFFFGGFESVSNLMCFMAHELAENLDVQSRLREEIMETSNACSGKLTYEAMLKMKYMDMVVSETLRKWPNNVATDRVCTKSYTIEPSKPGEAPIHLTKGDMIWVPIYGLHHDYRYFPHPERFDPERFSDENKDKIVPYSYLPFGAGPRNCIGSRFALLETKAVFFHLLSHFEIVPTYKTQIPLRINKKSFSFVAEDGFWLGLKKL
nr:unnamed protein product [Callosobruchus analis]